MIFSAVAFLPPFIRDVGELGDKLEILDTSDPGVMLALGHLTYDEAWLRLLSRLRALHAVLGTFRWFRLSFVGRFDGPAGASRIERSTHDVVADTGEILDATATDQARPSAPGGCGLRPECRW